MASAHIGRFSSAVHKDIRIDLSPGSRGFSFCQSSNDRQPSYSKGADASSATATFNLGWRRPDFAWDFASACACETLALVDGREHKRGTRTRADQAVPGIDPKDLSYLGYGDKRKKADGSNHNARGPRPAGDDELGVSMGERPGHDPSAIRCCSRTWFTLASRGQALVVLVSRKKAVAFCHRSASNRRAQSSARGCSVRRGPRANRRS